MKQQQILQMAKDICRVKHICTDVCEPISACDALRYAERAVEAGYCKQEWISVDERLPEMHKDVLCFNGRSVGIDFICSDGTWCEEVNHVIPVTHWMPLPEAPKGGAE